MVGPKNLWVITNVEKKVIIKELRKLMEPSWMSRSVNSKTIVLPSLELSLKALSLMTTIMFVRRMTPEINKEFKIAYLNCALGLEIKPKKLLLFLDITTPLAKYKV